MKKRQLKKWLAKYQLLSTIASNYLENNDEYIEMVEDGWYNTVFTIEDGVFIMLMQNEHNDLRFKFEIPLEVFYSGLFNPA